jgi:hypothetical protein
MPWKDVVNEQLFQPETYTSKSYKSPFNKLIYPSGWHQSQVYF